MSPLAPARYLSSLLAAAMLLFTGCSKPATAPANKPAAAAAKATDKAAPKATEQQKAAAEPAVDDPNAKLMAAYHAIRCVLAGQVRPDDKVYAAHGFKDAADFSTAFTEAATKDPAWAERAIAKSLELSCENAK